MPGGAINLTDPVEWGHPLNRGRVLWLYGLPQWSGGNTWFDLCRRANGTLTNGATWRPTPYGAGANFTGATQKVLIPANSSLADSNTWTLGCWVYPRSLAAYNTVFMGNNVGLLVSGASGNPMTFVWNAVGTEYNLATGMDTPLNEWSWVGLVIEPTQATVYRWKSAAGLQSYTTVNAQTTRPVNGTWNLGSGGGGANYWDGYTADASMRSLSLSAGDIRGVVDQSRRDYPDLLRRVRPWSFGVASAAAGNRRRRVIMCGGR